MLSGMTWLAEVWLGNNRIGNLSSLLDMDNPHLDTMDLVSVPYDPLISELVGEHVLALQACGVVVTFRPIPAK
ncbi:MAG: hypothetical protein F4X36_17350 [Gammaproteobacteria bacterium]|nr:hypothetical protein [Gammaproteobacteria bacterium]